jgi:hypothetical protein
MLINAIQKEYGVLNLLLVKDAFVVGVSTGATRKRGFFCVFGVGTWRLKRISTLRSSDLDS